MLPYNPYPKGYNVSKCTKCVSRSVPAPGLDAAIVRSACSVYRYHILLRCALSVSPNRYNVTKSIFHLKASPNRYNVTKSISHFSTAPERASSERPPYIQSLQVYVNNEAIQSI